MSKRTKYVPKHRHAPERAIVQAPKKALRSTVVMSSVAVAATGVAVSGGVLGGSAHVSTAAEHLGSRADAARPTADPSTAAVSGGRLIDRGPVISRSADRRKEADPAKEAALSNDAGRAETESVRLSQQDPRDIAKALLPQFGFSSDQFSCLDSLWTKESGWNVSADNPSSSAYGIPQALPGSKMASAGADWATNPATQIEWGLGYIRDSYGSPCAAWGHAQAYNWY